MFRGLVALLRMARELRRIRQILEIAFEKELTVAELYKSHPSKSLSFSELIIDTSPLIKRDMFGQVIPEDEEEEI